MKTAASRGAKTLGIGSIVLIGVLNFHPPHFLMESGYSTNVGSGGLEAALLAMVLAAVAAAVGIYRDARWGWLLGLVLAAIGVALYLIQETVGLPGLPRKWAEPSRILTLGLATVFVIMAWRTLTVAHRTAR